MSKTLELDKQDSKVSYTGAGWTGLAGGSEKDDQDAANILHGTGTFDNPPKQLADQSGSSAVGLQNGVHFQYDKRLDASTTEDAVDGFGATAGGIIDTGTSGVLSKAIRLVENAANIKSGINYTALKVYAKNLSALVSPGGDRCYIDPVIGKFVLPRPTYWSKCESVNNMTTGAEIFSQNVSFILGNTGQFDSPTAFPERWKWGKAWFNAGVTGDWNQTSLTFGACPTKFTLSYWSYMFLDASWNQQIAICLKGADLTNFIGFRHNAGVIDHSIYADGEEKSNNTSVNFSTIKHVYIVFDNSKGLTDGKSVRVFINGIERLSTTATFTLGTFHIWQIGNNATSSSIDNIKFWKDEIVSEDPSFEYNAGSGREDALHVIYGATNGYKPVNIKLSYFYLATSVTPAIMAKPGADSTIQLENASNVVNGAGTFGLSSVMRKSDYNQLVSDVDYVYDELLSSGTYDIYDDSASGAFAVGKYMRLVEASKNVSDATGLNLVVRAKNLSTIITPPSTEAYIDPARAIFVLPRPTYWSDCLNEDSFKINAKIKHGTINTAGTWYYGAGSVAFGKGFGTNVQYDYGAYGSFYVTGIPGESVDLSKFTCSFHVNVYAGWHNSGTYTTFGFNVSIGNIAIVLTPSDIYHASTHYIDVYVNGALETRYGPYADSTAQHICVIGDSSAGLSGSKTVKVYLDGSLLHQSTTVFNNTNTTMSISTTGACYWNYVGASALIGNVKLFDHAIDQVPTWVSATEDALHYMYGASNNYKPALTAPGGVGYYKAGGNGNYVSWKTLTDY